MANDAPATNAGPPRSSWRDYETTHSPFHASRGYECLDVQESDEPAPGEQTCARCQAKPATVRIFRVGADHVARDCWFFCAGCFEAMVGSGEVQLTP